MTGHRLTEADWRLFTTLLRFDVAYVGHFKCNLRRIADYPNLSGYLRDLYQVPGVADTVDMRHIKGHYYQSHRTINPTGIVAAGPSWTLLFHMGAVDRSGRRRLPAQVQKPRRERHNAAPRLRAQTGRSFTYCSAACAALVLSEELSRYGGNLALCFDDPVEVRL